MGAKYKKKYLGEVKAYAPAYRKFVKPGDVVPVLEKEQLALDLISGAVKDVDVKGLSDKRAKAKQAWAEKVKASYKSIDEYYAGKGWELVKADKPKPAKKAKAEKEG